MTGSRGRPALASDDWMLEQQVRAEMEAEAWRRLRQDLAQTQTAPVPAPTPIPAAPPIVQADPHTSGSLILKALVRFALAAFGAYLCYLAAIDSQLGAIEAWLAAGSGFLVTLCLTMFGPVRRLVHTMAEAARWVLIFAVGLGVVWMFTHYSA